MKPVDTRPRGNIYSMTHQKQVLGIECPLCKHRKVFHPRELINFSGVGEMLSCASAMNMMRCATCGARDPDGVVMPEAEGEAWASGGKK